jgi:hypothetical protein
LKDKKNSALRENVLCGIIEPEKFAAMTSEEMASDEVCFAPLDFYVLYPYIFMF